MSIISKVKIEEKAIEVEYPDIDGFKIEIVYLSRDVLAKIRNKSLKVKFNRVSRQKEEEVDNDLFLRNYSDRVIKGWSGLKIKHLPKLLACDIKGMNGEDLVPHTPDDAHDLLKNSIDFDRFITDTLNDLDAFNSTKNETEIKN